jgi:hypothetical protein
VRHAAAYVINFDNFTTTTRTPRHELADWAGDLSGNGHGDWLPARSGRDRLRLPPFIGAIWRDAGD